MPGHIDTSKDMWRLMYDGYRCKAFMLVSTYIYIFTCKHVHILILVGLHTYMHKYIRHSYISYPVKL